MKGDGRRKRTRHTRETIGRIHDMYLVNQRTKRKELRDSKGKERCGEAKRDDGAYCSSSLFNDLVMGEGNGRVPFGT